LDNPRYINFGELSHFYEKFTKKWLNKYVNNKSRINQILSNEKCFLIINDGFIEHHSEISNPKSKSHTPDRKKITERFLAIWYPMVQNGDWELTKRLQSHSINLLN
jgi:hypothetical protein